ncbi:MAG: hypothetical protein V1754_04525 [Pseudomonadota bacterium]
MQFLILSFKHVICLGFFSSIILLGCSSSNDTPPGKQDTGVKSDAITNADASEADAQNYDIALINDTGITDTAQSDAISDSLTHDSALPITRLSIEPLCLLPGNVLAPDPSEIGHLAAVRLTPFYYPFTVASVSYSLNGSSGTCNTGVAHRVEVFVDTTVTPNANPTIAETINVPAGTSAPLSREVKLPLTTPIKLQKGEHIFIAVEMAGDITGLNICLVACASAGPVDRNYWSNATQAPYAWATMASRGTNVNFFIHAWGK